MIDLGSDTPIADMVEKLLSGGSPVEAVVLAVRTAERILREYSRSGGATDLVADRRREWDRERKRRERLSGQNLSGGHPVEVAESRSLTTEQPINDSMSYEERADSRSSGGRPVDAAPRKAKSPRKQGFVCPSDWVPNDGHYVLGESLGFSRAQVANMGASMVSWSAANANREVARKLDWNAAFSTWMRKKHDDQPRGRGGPGGGAPRPTFFDIASGRG